MRFNSVEKACSRRAGRRQPPDQKLDRRSVRGLTPPGSPEGSKWVVKFSRVYAARLAFVVVAFLTASPAMAQRELRIRTLPETPLPYLTTCVAPTARLAVVSDPANTLVVGHRPKIPPVAGMVVPHLSVFRLNEQGQLAPGEPLTIMLPKPAGLAERPTHVLGLACHPRYPLLYVWQDVDVIPEGQTVDPTAAAEFDHCLIYSLDENPPRLVFATARGNDYHLGANNGGIFLDVPNGRLYVPNMQVPGPMKTPVAALGWLQIAPDGLPALLIPGNSVEPVAPAAPLDPAAAAASRTARLAAFEQSKAAGAPLLLGKYLEIAGITLSWPSPYSYAPISADAVLLSSHSGPVTWMLSDRLARFNNFFLTPYIAYRYRLSAHPVQPLMYVTIVGYDGRIVAVEHSDGYPTLTPRTVSLDNMVIHSPPLIVSKPDRVIVGAVGRVCVVELDEKGRFKPQGVSMTVNNPTVEALAWSEKFARLYVPVEKTP